MTGRAGGGRRVHLRPHTSILSVSYSRFTIIVVDAKKQNKTKQNKQKKPTEIYLLLSNATQLSNAPLSVWPCFSSFFYYFYHYYYLQMPNTFLIDHSVMQIF